MKVADLINQLKHYPEHWDVEINVRVGEYVSCSTIDYLHQDRGLVVIVGKLKPPEDLDEEQAD